MTCAQAPFSGARSDGRISYRPLVEERDRCFPFDGVPHRWWNLIHLLVSLSLGVSAAAMVDTDDCSVRDRERIGTDAEECAETPAQAYEESTGLAHVRR